MVEKVYVQLLVNIFPRHLSYITFFCIFQVERYSRTIVPICLPNPRDGYLINVRVEELGWLLMDKIHTRGVVFVESTYCWSVADHLCWLSFIDCWLLLYTHRKDRLPIFPALASWSSRWAVPWSTPQSSRLLGWSFLLAFFFLLPTFTFLNFWEQNLAQNISLNGLLQLETWFLFTLITFLWVHIWKTAQGNDHIERSLPQLVGHKVSRPHHEDVYDQRRQWQWFIFCQCC